MPTPKTKPAEPRSRDADRSQLAILLAARDEFAQHGLGGARVDRIAERADVNKRLIYYYFKSKDELFLAVLENAYARHPRSGDRTAPARHGPGPGHPPAGRNSPGNTTLPTPSF
jgi:AcrR family transcriptional regulator